MSDDIFFPVLIAVEIAVWIAALRAKSPAVRLTARVLLVMLLIFALLLLKTAVEVAAGQ